MQYSDRASTEIQDRLTKTTPPMNTVIAERLLLEVKEIMEHLGVRFFLRQGTCLAAVRDNAFIPWDDDLDIGVILGSNGFTEQSVDPLLSNFRENGFYVQSESSATIIYSSLMKYNMRVDVLFHRIVDETIYHFPGIWLPAILFRELKEVRFLGETFLVPNPPEEYLRIKYGPDWQTPKRFDYAKDVVDNIPIENSPRFLGRAARSIVRLLKLGNVTTLRVLDENGLPVNRTDVRIVGMGSFRTNEEGCAKLYLQTKDWFPSGVRKWGLSSP